MPIFLSTLESFPLRLMLILSVLTSCYLSSRRIIKVTKLGVTRENPCNNDVLGSFLPKELLKDSGTVTDPEMRKICSNLVYSCCDSEMINIMTDDLKLSLSYLSERNKEMKQLLANVSHIAYETFKIFMDEFTEADISCYNKVQDMSMDDKRNVYANDEAMLKEIDIYSNIIQFNKLKLLDHFKELKKLVKPFIETLVDQEDLSAKYYSSYICSMCSPEFVNILKTDRTPPQMNVDLSFCSTLMKRRVEFYNWKNVYFYTQQIVDLSFCARTNSKSEKNFEGVGWKDIDIILEDPEIIKQNLTRLNNCIKNPMNLMVDPLKKDSCMNICKKNLRFPVVKMLSINRFMNAENELHNMFLSTKESRHPAVRVKERVDNFDIIRSVLKQRGILEYGTGDEIYLSLIKVMENPSVDFKTLNLSISKIGVMSIGANVMNSIYYTGVELLQIAGLIWLVVLFK